MEKTNVYAELVKVLNEMRNPINSVENNYFKSKYVPLSDILEISRPILSKYGFALLQVPTVVYESVQTRNGSIQENGVVKVKTSLIHSSGEQIDFPEIIIKAKDANAQSVGSAITYARRYALTAILGICGKDEDDDGNMANGHYSYPTDVPMQTYNPYQQPTITQEQANTLFGYVNKLANLRNVEVQRIINSLQVSKLEEIPQNQYQTILNQLVNWVKQAEQDQSQKQNTAQQTSSQTQPSQTQSSQTQPSTTQQPKSPQTNSIPSERYFIERIEQGTTAGNIRYARLYAIHKATNQRTEILVHQDKIGFVDYIQEGQEMNLSVAEQGGFKVLVALGGNNHAA